MWKQGQIKTLLSYLGKRISGCCGQTPGDLSCGPWAGRGWDEKTGDKERQENKRPCIQAFGSGFASLGWAPGVLSSGPWPGVGWVCCGTGECGEWEGLAWVYGLDRKHGVPMNVCAAGLLCGFASSGWAPGVLSCGPWPGVG